VSRLLLLVVLSGLAGCGSPTGPGELAGGVLATFEVGAEQFKVFVTSPSAIDQLLQLKEGTSVTNIPNGRIRTGPGAARHNSPYSWHLDPKDIEMAFATPEVCDGAPSYVQQHVNEYVKVVKRYCPWGAKLVALEDFR